MALEGPPLVLVEESHHGGDDVSNLADQLLDLLLELFTRVLLVAAVAQVTHLVQNEASSLVFASDGNFLAINFVREGVNQSPVVIFTLLKLFLLVFSFLDLSLRLLE